MKNLILACLLLTTPCFAETFMGQAELKNTTKEDVVVIGTAELEDMTVKSLNVTGPLKFKKLIVKGTTSITGPMKGEKGTFADVQGTGHIDIKESELKSLKATGEVELKKVTISGNTEVIGDLEIEKSTVQDIIATAEKVKLEAVNAKNITIKKNDGSTKIQELSIKDDSVISGNITFEAGKGLVKIESGVKFTGTVKGAEVQK